jgi:hypothetical protein
VPLSNYKKFFAPTDLRRLCTVTAARMVALASL